MILNEFKFRLMMYITTRLGGSSDTRLSTKSCKVSSAFRKRLNGRRRHTQQRASTHRPDTLVSLTWKTKYWLTHLASLKHLYINSLNTPGCLSPIALQPGTFYRKCWAGPSHGASSKEHTTHGNILNEGRKITQSFT